MPRIPLPAVDPKARAIWAVRERARCVAEACSAFAHTPAQAARPARIASGAPWCGARRGGRAAAPTRSHAAKRRRARRGVMVARSDAPGDAAQGGGAAAAHGPHQTHTASLRGACQRADVRRPSHARSAAAASRRRRRRMLPQHAHRATRAARHRGMQGGRGRHAVGHTAALVGAAVPGAAAAPDATTHSQQQRTHARRAQAGGRLT